MLFLAGKYVQPAKLNAITRQIIYEEIDEPDYAFSSDDEVNNWNTTENRDVMNSTQTNTFQSSCYTWTYESCSWKTKTNSS